MTTIQIKLYWDRYHAHPWGQNPGRVKDAEWPPSPWRLLRSLASAWFRSHPGVGHSDELRAVIDALGQRLPLIGIGKVSFSQTVHYQPNYGKGDKATARYGTTRHENHFAATSQPICFRWIDLTLDEQQKSLLTTLLEHVSYFGRADSICEATLQPDNWEQPAAFGWCKPCLSDEFKPQRRIDPKCRDVFCPEPSGFQLTDLWQRRTSETKPENAPIHLVNQMLSTDMRVDGGLLVSYEMPDGWPHEWVVRVARSSVTPAKAGTRTVARTLCFSLQCRIGIPLKATVDVAERFRLSAIKRFKEAHGQDAHSFALSGHDPRPEGVGEDHQHAHFLSLPSNLSNSGQIDELHVWAPCGFTQPEVEALMRVMTVHWGASKYPIRPVLTSIDQSQPQFLSGQTARIWRSLTPFVPPRHFYRGSLHGAKLKQRDTPENQLAEELRRAEIGDPKEIRRLPLNLSDAGADPLQSRWDIVRAPGDNPAFDDAVSAVARAGSKRYERRVGFFFQLEFENPVCLHRPFGHSSHFGLGLFVPID